MSLAPWATRDEDSRGRRYPEPEPRYRSVYQRDRDRIIHSTAFRRLVYKTQVFVNHEGDLYRTRMTHSLEVAQISRTIAGALGLNEYLVEAISLAHDLGHTPFGHAGQTALNRCLRGHGGFEHNLQSLRVVDELEVKYADFPGLNLSYETREGILKHCAPRMARRLGELGQRFLEGGQPSLEAQLANRADEVAYNNHDVDDGLRAGLLDLEGLRGVALFAACYDEVQARYPGLGGRRMVHEVVRRMIDRMVTDLIDESRCRLEAGAPADAAAARAAAGPLIAFSTAMQGRITELSRYLRRALYKHPRVRAMTTHAVGTVTALFHRYAEDPAQLPGSHAEAVRDAVGEDARLRRVADYVAGMTDRFALAEAERLGVPG